MEDPNRPTLHLDQEIIGQKRPIQSPSRSVDWFASKAWKETFLWTRIEKMPDEMVKMIFESSEELNEMSTSENEHFYLWLHNIMKP